MGVRHALLGLLAASCVCVVLWSSSPLGSSPSLSGSLPDGTTALLGQGVPSGVGAGYGGQYAYPYHYYHPRYAAWVQHQAAVRGLDRKIDGEEGKLHKLERVDREMQLRRKAIEDEMGNLVKASDKMAGDLARLRGGYGGQIARLRDEYHDTLKNLNEEKVAAHEEMRNLDFQEKELLDNVASTRASAAAHKEEAKHLKDDVVGMRDRAATEEKKGQLSLGIADSHYKLRLKQQAMQADSLSETAAASIRAQAMPKVAHIQAHTAHVVNAIEHHTAVVEGHAGQKKTVKHAADVAAEDARTLQEELEMRARHLKKQLVKEEGEVLDARGKEAMARARAVRYMNRMHGAKHDYFRVMHDEGVARARILAAQRIIDGAVAKRLVSEAAESMADVVAKGDEEAAKRAKNRSVVDTQEAHWQVRLDTVRARQDEMLREEAFEEALQSYGTQLNAEGMVHEEYGRAHLHNVVSDSLIHVLRKRADRSDRLLRDVTVAAGGALEAADAAHDSMNGAKDAEGKVVG